MEQGHYKCLFCTHVFKFSCTCHWFIHPLCKIALCSNGHKICFELDTSKELCFKCNPVKKWETNHIFQGLKERIYLLPGRTTEIFLYDSSLTEWKSYSVFEMIAFSRATITTLFDLYLPQKQQWDEETRNARIEWLKCALRMDGSQIVKDVALQIACLLNKKPYVLCGQAKQNESPKRQK